jgi:SAM-dependent methyltransferase
LGGGWGEFADRIRAVPPGSTVLDLGAGEAELRHELQHTRYIALDRGIGHAGWDYSRLDVVADASAIPLRERSVDAIVCKQVLEHVPEPIALLREASRVLTRGGFVLLSTNQAWPQHQKPYDFFRFTSFGLRYCFEQAGFVIRDMQPMGGAFTCALFHFSQTMSPHLWTRSDRGARIVSVITKPVSWALRVLTIVASLLDRLDKTPDNTLGWYVLADHAASVPHAKTETAGRADGST